MQANSTPHHQSGAESAARNHEPSVYDFECRRIDGRLIPLADYRGQILLIVNTASRCGFTPQYRGLEELYQRYHGQGFSVLAFPCDQFLKQEHAENEHIEEFCLTRYQVSFPLFEKVDVNGPGEAPLFGYLKSRATGWLGTRGIKWNFTKFLVNREGHCVKRFGPATYPTQIGRHLEGFL